MNRFNRRGKSLKSKSLENLVKMTDKMCLATSHGVVKRPVDNQSSPIREISSDTTSQVLEDTSLHHNTFAQLWSFYQSGDYTDVCLVIGSTQLNCHRVILALTSKYFHAMFSSKMAEQDKKTVTIKDIDENAAEALVRFAYSGRLEITVETVQPLLYAASYLQFDAAVNVCAHFLQDRLDVQNCIGVRAFAEQHNHICLIELVDRFTCEHFVELVEMDEFLTRSADHLLALIRSDDLVVESEQIVYEAVMKWIKKDVENRKKYLPILMEEVRLPLLPPHYMMVHVEGEELLRRDLQCRDYLDEAKDYHIANVVPRKIKYSKRTTPRKAYAGVIFCFGGRGSSGEPFNTVECYDLKQDAWFSAVNMNCQRRHVGVASVDGKVYAVGGHDGKRHLNSVEVYHPQMGTWKFVSSMNTKRRGIAIGCLTYDRGPLYAVGGLDDAQCYDTVERYDLQNDTWCLVASMNFSRGGVAVATFKGYLYACGGNDGSESLRSCERYDPHLNKWTLITPMNCRRAGAACTAVNGYIYAIGGFDNNAPLNSVERYDPDTNQWTELKPMNCRRGGVGVASICGLLYAVGGHDGHSYLDTVEAYNPVTDIWEEKAPISIRRAGAGVVWCDVSLATVAAFRQPTISRKPGLPSVKY